MFHWWKPLHLQYFVISCGGRLAAFSTQDLKRGAVSDIFPSPSSDLSHGCPPENIRQNYVLFFSVSARVNALFFMCTGYVNLEAWPRSQLLADWRHLWDTVWTQLKVLTIGVTKGHETEIFRNYHFNTPSEDTRLVCSKYVCSWSISALYIHSYSTHQMDT